jgi:hypothetical protein
MPFNDLCAMMESEYVRGEVDRAKALCQRNWRRKFACGTARAILWQDNYLEFVGASPGKMKTTPE